MMAQPGASQPMGVQPYRPQGPPRPGALPMQTPQPFRAQPMLPAQRPDDPNSVLPPRALAGLLSTVDKEVGDSLAASSLCSGYQAAARC